MALVLTSAVGMAQENVPTVNFHYAFAPPHRITVALPDSSNKTLLDAMPGKLLMSWTYENLIYYSFLRPIPLRRRWGFKTPQPTLAR